MQFWPCTRTATLRVLHVLTLNQQSLERAANFRYVRCADSHRQSAVLVAIASLGGKVSRLFNADSRRTKKASWPVSINGFSPPETVMVTHSCK